MLFLHVQLGNSGILRKHDLEMYQRSLRLVRDMIRASNVVPDAISFSQTQLVEIKALAAGGNATIFKAEHLVEGKSEVVVLKLSRTWCDGDDAAQERMKKVKLENIANSIIDLTSYRD